MSVNIETKVSARIALLYLRYPLASRKIMAAPVATNAPREPVSISKIMEIALTNSDSRIPTRFQMYTLAKSNRPIMRPNVFAPPPKTASLPGLGAWNVLKAAIAANIAPIINIHFQKLSITRD